MPAFEPIQPEVMGGGSNFTNAFADVDNDGFYDLFIPDGVASRLLRNRGERVDEMELRAMVPVSVRTDTEKGALGNKVASLWAPLPVFEEDPLERLRLVHESMKDLKASGQAVGAELLTSIGEWAPPTILAQGARLVDGAAVVGDVRRERRGHRAVVGGARRPVRPRPESDPVAADRTLGR